MPARRKHPDGAARQAAYRQRRAAAAQEREGRAPVVPAVPGPARWKALVQETQLLLDALYAEMASYFEQRTERWQESERGEALQERLQAIEEAQAALEQVVG